MAEIEINNLADYGLVRDTKPYMIPPEAWSLATNVRYKDGAVESLLGWEQVFGTPTVPPYHLLPFRTQANAFWIYAGLTAVYVWDGNTHTDITRAAGAYTAVDAASWNSTLLASLPILNNGTDVPQVWLTPTVATDLTNLANWPGTLRAKVVRALGPYLVAFNITDSGNNFPHRVRWSHAADPGSVPSSWDITDPTVDAGDKELEDVHAGVIVDALRLQNSMMIYKEESTWKMDIIGGRFIMGFRQYLTTSGLLAPRCVAVTSDGTRHVVVTQDDIIVHNGTGEPQSILEKRMRRTLFADIDTSNYKSSFVYNDPEYGEIWFCYPSAGNSVPNKALIWNYKEGSRGSLTEAEGITYQHAAVGTIESATDETWDGGPDDAWDSDDTPWSIINRRRVLAASPQNTKLFKLNSGIQRDGVAFESVAQREGLAILGKKRNGEWINDFQRFKLWDRVWLKMGGSGITVRVGGQQVVDGPISWTDAVAFDPTTQSFITRQKSGRALAIEFRGDGTAQWRLDGYKPNIMPMGIY